MKTRQQAKPIRLGRDANGKRHYLPHRYRKYHLQILGAPGRGKSKYMEYLLRRDILNRHGLCLVDPHGGLYTDIVRWCVQKGISKKRIVLIEPAQQDWTCGFNPLDLRGLSPAEMADAVDAMVRACTQVWGGEDMHKTPRLARILPAIFHTLAFRQLSLAEALDLCDAYNRDSLRAYLTADLEDPVFRDEWEQFNQLDPRTFTEIFESTRNRLAAFLRNPVVRTMLSQTEAVIDLARAMDDGSVVLVNLGGLSQENAKLLGALFVNALFHKALRRVPEKSRPFYLYLDECYYFFNEDISRILTEGRKFGLHAILAHQNLGQLRSAGDAVYTAVMQIENKVVFGGVRPPADAAEVAEAIYTGSLQLDEPKAHSLRPVVTGYVKEWMRSKSTTHTETSGESASAGASETVAAGEDGSGALTAGTSETAVEVASVSIANSESRSETLMPVLSMLPAEFWDLREQIYRAMATMVEQPTQQAIVKLFNELPVQVSTPTVSEAVVRDERVEKFKQAVFEQTAFSLPAAEALEVIDRRRTALRLAAKKYAHRGEPRDDEFYE